MAAGRPSTTPSIGFGDTHTYTRDLERIGGEAGVRIKVSSSTPWREYTATLGAGADGAGD